MRGVKWKRNAQASIKERASAQLEDPKEMLEQKTGAVANGSFRFSRNHGPCTSLTQSGLDISDRVSSSVDGSAARCIFYLLAFTPYPTSFSKRLLFNKRTGKSGVLRKCLQTRFNSPYCSRAILVFRQSYDRLVE